MNISYRPEWHLWWPDWDQKAEQNYNYIIRNLPTMDFAISQTKKFGVCVQAGGHVGIWPMHLIDHFSKVYTFEPEPDLFEALSVNITALPANGQDIIETKSALSWTTGEAALLRSTSSGSNKIISDFQDPYFARINGGQKVATIAIDSLNLPTCDAIFLDIEGHEFWALRGAKDTIAEYKPVIQVEELQNDSVGNLEVEKLLIAYGYQRHPEKQGKDAVYLPC